MDIVQLLVILAVGVIALVVVFYLLQQVSIDPAVRRIITIAMVVIIGIVAIILLLNIGGFNTHGPIVRTP